MLLKTLLRFPSIRQLRPVMESRDMVLHVTV